MQLTETSLYAHPYAHLASAQATRLAVLLSVACWTTTPSMLSWGRPLFSCKCATTCWPV